MKALLCLCLLTAFCLPEAMAQDNSEAALFSRVRSRREEARKNPSTGAIARFDRRSRSYLRSFPNGARSSIVLLWRGDILREVKPREAWKAYRRSSEAAARGRAARIEFLHAPPVPIRTEGWVGDEVDLAKPYNGVTLVAFFSFAHPLTRDVLNQLVGWHLKHFKRGLRIVGVAAVVDRHKQQTPARLRSQIMEYLLPFPVAIDKQVPGGKSLSLKTYLGNKVPWCVLIDRYGRLRAAEELPLSGNALAASERTIVKMLDAPTCDVLQHRLERGEMDALATLSSVRNQRAVDVLFDVWNKTKDDSTKDRVQETLEEMLPEGFDIRTWPNARGRLRYSLETDKLQ
ncbi:MAG: hypothetical protein V3T86_13105 [Planctomycetota bacterium]